MFKIKNDNIFNIVIIIFLLTCGWLFFANLSDHLLWNDEAFTSVTARNIMQFGYPRSFDGLNFLYPSSPEFNWPGTYICIVDPWFPLYLMVPSFKLFTANTWSARIPFVLAGFSTLVILLFFCVRYLKSKGIGFISILLLGTSVPFLLHSRQARYYGLVAFLCLAIFYLYHRILAEGKGYFCLGLISAVLSLSHHVVFVPMFCSMWVMAFFIDRREMDWKRFVSASIIPAVVFLAWVSISMIGMSDTTSFPVNTTLIQIKKNLEFQVRTINGYFMPIASWAMILIFFRVFKRHSIFKMSSAESKTLKRAAIFLICNIIFFSIFGIRTMRYYIQYLPFLCIAEAFLLYRIFKWKRIAAVTIMAMVIFTNLPAKADPAKFRSYFLDYLYELSHKYTGPLEALCDYLDLHAKPGEQIKIVKGDMTVMFYHPELAVINDNRYFRKTYPEWIVVRKYWNPIFEKKWEDLGYEIEEGYLDVLERYEKIPLHAVDSIRENVPDNLNEHFFKSPKITPENQMYVYRLKYER